MTYDGFYVPRSWHIRNEDNYIEKLKNKQTNLTISATGGCYHQIFLIKNDNNLKKNIGKIDKFNKNDENVSLIRTTMRCRKKSKTTISAITTYNIGFFLLDMSARLNSAAVAVDWELMILYC